LRTSILENLPKLSPPIFKSSLLPSPPIATAVYAPDHVELYLNRNTSRRGVSRCVHYNEADGHGSVTVSQRYVHPSLESMERAFERLEALNTARREEARKKRRERSAGP